jgi:hypothetical protein
VRRVARGGSEVITLPNAKPAPPWDWTMSYARCYALPEVAADKRHVYILHGVLSAWPFASALEIGSFNGATAVAFVEAINGKTGLGRYGRAFFCDVSVTHSLVDVVRNCREPDRVHITAQPSWAVLDSKEPFDFVYVDGAHDMDSVTLEVAKLLPRKPLCVMAHDTSATAAGYSKCEGAAMLAATFRNTPGYRCIEDNKDRPGERTSRGMFLATTSDELYEVARDVFNKWG